MGDKTFTPNIWPLLVLALFSFTLAGQAATEGPDAMRRLGIEPIESLTIAPEEGDKWKGLLNQNYGVFIGVEQFVDTTIHPLSCARKDAEEMHKLFVKDMGFIPEENTRLLVSGRGPSHAPTRLNILDAIKMAALQAGKDGTIVVQISTHGVEDYILSEDSRRSLLEESAVSIKWVKETLVESECPRRFVIFDACREVLTRDTKSVSGPRNQEFVEELLESKGLVVMMSCEKEEFSYEMPEKGHGAFTYFLLETLRGGSLSGNEKGYITVTELSRHVREKVRAWSAHKPSGIQSPVVNVLEASGDLPLAVSGKYVYDQLKKKINECYVILAEKNAEREITESQFNILSDSLRSRKAEERQVVFDFLDGKLDVRYAVMLLKTLSSAPAAPAFSAPAAATPTPRPISRPESPVKSAAPEQNTSRFSQHGDLIMDRNLNVVWYCAGKMETYTYKEAQKMVEHVLPQKLFTQSGGKLGRYRLPTESELRSLEQNYKEAQKIFDIDVFAIPSYWCEASQFSRLAGEGLVGRMEQGGITLTPVARMEKHRLLAVCPYTLKR